MTAPRLSDHPTRNRSSSASSPLWPPTRFVLETKGGLKIAKVLVSCSGSLDVVDKNGVNFIIIFSLFGSAFFAGIDGFISCRLPQVKSSIIMLDTLGTLCDMMGEDLAADHHLAAVLLPPLMAIWQSIRDDDKVRLSRWHRFLPSRES